MVKHLSLRTLAVLLIAVLLAACSTNPAPPTEATNEVEDESRLVTQSDELKFSPPSRVIENFGQDRGGWRVSKHVRVMADVNGDGKEDIVGIGENGVYVSLSNTAEDATTATYGPAQKWSSDFGYNRGWRRGTHPRYVKDVDNDGRADVIGFGNKGVYIAFSNGTRFDESKLWIIGFGADAGWRPEQPRLVADVNGDGLLDIIGFGKDGVYVSVNFDDRFAVPKRWSADFGDDAGWQANKHPRFVVDMNGDKRADLVGIKDDGGYYALSTGTGFAQTQVGINDLGYNQGWRSDKHKRLLADVNGDGRADAVGFGQNGVYLSLAVSTGAGFGPVRLVTPSYSYERGWRNDLHPRFLADVNGDGKADIIGFSSIGVFVSLSNGAGFEPPVRVLDAFSYNGGWRSEFHPRLMADANGDGKADIAGFSSIGVYIALSLSQLPTSPAPPSPPPLPKGNVAALQIEPAAVLFTAKDQSETLTVKAYDDEGNEVSTEGLGLEWLSSDSSAVQVTQSQSQPNTATVRALTDLGSAVLSVRSNVNTDLISPPLMVTIAKVKAGVKLISDDEVAFPPVNLPPGATPATYPLPFVETVGSETRIAGFSVDEVMANFEAVGDVLRYPVVLLGTNLQAGDMLLASQGAEVMGRVLTVQERDGFVLAQIETPRLSEVFDDLDVNFDSAELTDKGLVTDASMNRLLSNDEFTQSDLSTLGLSLSDCEFSGGVTLLNFSLPAPQLSFTPIIDGKIDLDRDIYRILLGLKVEFKVEPGIKLKKGLEGSITCPIGEELEVSLPLPAGPLSAILSGKATFQPKFAGVVKFEHGPDVEGKATLGATLLVQAGFDTRLAEPNLSRAEFTPIADSQLKVTDANDDLSFDLTVKVFEEGTLGIQLGGKVLSSASRWASWFGLGSLVQKVANALYIDAITGTVGPQGQLVWENNKRVLNQEASNSTISIDSVFELSLESKALNAVLKRIGAAPLSFSLAKQTSNLGKLHRVFEKDELHAQSSCFNGVVGKEGLVCVQVDGQVTFTVKAKYQDGTAIFGDTVLDKGEVWLDNENTLIASATPMSNTSMQATVRVSEELCDKSLEFLSYNTRWFISFPGHTGKVKLDCRNQAPLVDRLSATTTENTPVTINVAQTVTDPDGDPVVISISQSPSNGTAILNNGVVTYTPKTDFSGTDTIGYTATDTSGAKASEAIIITVTENQPPMVEAVSQTTPKNTPVTIDLSQIVSDPEGDRVTLRIKRSPANGRAFALLDGSGINYTPSRDFVGTDILEYTATDSKGKSASATITIRVLDGPDAVDDVIDLELSTGLQIAPFLEVLQNDTDPNNEPLSIVSVSPAKTGSVTRFGNNLQYSHKSGHEDSFTYTIRNRSGATDTAKVTIRKNTPPVANADVFKATGGPTTFDPVPLDVINGNAFGGTADADHDGDRLEIVDFDRVIGLTKEGNQLVFEPSAEGEFTFTYTIRDILPDHLQHLEREAKATVTVIIDRKIPTPQ